MNPFVEPAISGDPPGSGCWSYVPSLAAPLEARLSFHFFLGLHFPLRLIPHRQLTWISSVVTKEFFQTYKSITIFVMFF